MSKKGQLTELKMSKSRRVFIANMLKSGLSLGAAALFAGTANSDEGTTEHLDIEYDYIVVGSGSAGLIVACRLSEVGYSVLLIEAGQGSINQDKLTKSSLWMNNIGTETDWNLAAVAQRGFGGRSVGISAGKVLGGSGSINAMFWLKPDERDLSKLSCRAWAPFERDRFNAAVAEIERFLPGGGGRFHSGKISVGRYAQENPIASASIEAAVGMGAKLTDHNASEQIDGVGLADVNITPDGLRSGPAQTYLVEALERDNFHCLTGALATRLVIEHGKCIGLEFVSNNLQQRAYARREVIVSAGALGSPKLLMLSGIGPEKHLRRVGIKPKTVLESVGDNLQDHVFVSGLTYAAGPDYSSNITLGRIATHSFHSTAISSQPPNIQIMCMQVPFPPNSSTNDEGFSLLPWAAKIESVGTVSLKSSNAAEPLVINPAYLSTKNDINTLSAAVEIAIELGESSAFRGYIGGRKFELGALKSKKGKLRFIRENASPGLHFVGTCSAGVDPRSSVVSEDFKVWGVDGLRVVDGSVLPEVPGVNTQVAIMAIAEIASSMLLES